MRKGGLFEDLTRGVQADGRGRPVQGGLGRAGAGRSLPRHPARQLRLVCGTAGAGRQTSCVP